MCSMSCSELILGCCKVVRLWRHQEVSGPSQKTDSYITPCELGFFFFPTSVLFELNKVCTKSCYLEIKTSSQQNNWIGRRVASCSTLQGLTDVWFHTAHEQPISPRTDFAVLLTSSSDAVMFTTAATGHHLRNVHVGLKKAVRIFQPI